jgi:GMP synthase (glutamine-hydrolysing)
MRALVLMHAEPEGPGTIGSFFRSQGVELHTLRLYEGDRLPDDPGEFDAIVSLGGPMNVYEEEEFSFLRDETSFLRTAIVANVPILGVCLGAQMIAKAAGARVTQSPNREVGWCQVFLTEDGKRDAVFQCVPQALEVLQWHGDMFLIPEGGTLLAMGTECPHQAFRIHNAFGLQFHVEVTQGILTDWFTDSEEVELPQVLARFHEIKTELNRRAELIYRNFLGLVRDRM